MGRVSVLVVLLLLVPGLANAAEARPARLSERSWLVGALFAEDVEKVCAVSGPVGSERLGCATQATPVSDGRFENDGDAFEVLGPEGATRIGAMRIELSSSILDVRVIACKTVDDGFEICSDPSANFYALEVVTKPAPTEPIDVEKLDAALGQAEDAAVELTTAIRNARAELRPE